MDRLRSLIIAFTVATTLAGCGDDGGPPGTEVGCEWFAGDNCWKTGVDEAADCAHDSSDPGTLSADGLTCTFADGTEITFANPVDVSDMSDYEWDFTIRVDGSFCMSYRNIDDGPIELTTRSGTFSEQSYGFALGLTCQDGTPYRVSNAMDLLECEDAFQILPGHISSWSSGGMSFSLNAGTNGSVPLFTCEEP